MPRVKGTKVERVPVRIPKTLIDVVDKIVERTPIIAPNRQQFVELAVREKIQREMKQASQ